jgi:broad specificity phosphatase PhoE
MRLILVRHGEAYAGLHGLVPGPRGCGGLTPHGRRQAEALRDHLCDTGRLRADVLVASLLPRAIETAAVIAPALGVTTFAQDCDLCEVHTGDADGMPWEDYLGRYGSLDMVAEPDRAFAPAGESWNGFHLRVEALLGRLAQEHPGRTVVAVCHAGVISASLRVLLGISRAAIGARLHPTNTGLTEWDHEAGLDRWTLHTYNDAGHLLALPAG